MKNTNVLTQLSILLCGYLISTLSLNAQSHAFSSCQCKVYTFNEAVTDYTTYNKMLSIYNIDIDFDTRKITIETMREGYIYKINSERDRADYKEDIQYFFPGVIDYEGDLCQVLFEKLPNDEGSLTIFYPGNKKIEYLCEKEHKYNFGDGFGDGISYGLGNRKLRGDLPKPSLISCVIPSRIIVKVQVDVDHEGNVVGEPTVIEATYHDECIYSAIIKAAKLTKFTANNTSRQRGWIRYMIEP